MNRLPLVYQILLAPVTVLLLTAGLFWYLLPYLSDIRNQNESVRDWTRRIEHLNASITAGRRLQELTREAQVDTPEARDDVQFNYLELSSIFSDNLLHPVLMDKIPAETYANLRQQESRIRYREPWNRSELRSALSETLPMLERLHDNFWDQKRIAYARYYANVNDTVPRTIGVSLVALVLIMVVGVALSLWTVRHTRARLGHLAASARAISTGGAVPIPAPSGRRDEVDDLADSLAKMTQRLLHVVHGETLLKGAEDERRRIAMDLHDQALSDLTSLARDLRNLRQHQDAPPEDWNKRIHELERHVEDAIDDIRDIMDDLRPQTLDTLGLDAALRSHLEKHLTRTNLPSWHLQVEPIVDSALSELQRVMLYRIALEIIENVVRHARATRYEIAIRRRDQKLVLSVEDNGQSYFNGQSNSLRGRGLANIEQRAKVLEAEPSWQPSRFSSGTRFELSMPIREAAERAATPPRSAHG